MLPPTLPPLPARTELKWKSSQDPTGATNRIADQGQQSLRRRQLTLRRPRRLQSMPQLVASFLMTTQEWTMPPSTDLAAAKRPAVRTSATPGPGIRQAGRASPSSGRRRRMSHPQRTATSRRQACAAVEARSSGPMTPPALPPPARSSAGAPDAEALSLLSFATRPPAAAPARQAPSGCSWSRVGRSAGFGKTHTLRTRNCA